MNASSPFWITLFTQCRASSEKRFGVSGVGWLGQLPEHWSVRKVRWLFEIQKRIAGTLGFDVYSITQQGIRVKDLESNDGQISMDYSKYQVVEPGDFAMNYMDLLTGGVDVAATNTESVDLAILLS